MPTRFKGKKTMSHLLIAEGQGTRRTCGMEDIIVIIFAKYNLPQACRLEFTLSKGLGPCQPSQEDKV
jgi:hypothetical protein